MSTNSLKLLIFGITIEIVSVVVNINTTMTCDEK